MSSNVVGYQKLTVPAGGYALLANPFTIVGSEGDTFAINDMFANDSEVSNAGNNSSQGDTIEIWNPADQGYGTPFFFSSRINGGGKAWALSSAPRVAVTDDMDAGDGFWYRNRGSSPISLLVSGEVATNDVKVTLAPGYNLVCNPFPADLPLNGGAIDWETAGSNAGNNSSQGDTIEIWDTTEQGYGTPFFFSSRINGGGKAWASSSAPRVAVTDTVPAGFGFWYRNRGTSDIVITLKSPLAADGE